jgi:uncharacterized protein YdaU (DUF1376 family)
MADLNIMPWYTDAYLADTTDLSTEEHGAYMLLLMTMWRAGGSLPNDPEFLRRVVKATPCKWSSIWKVLSRFFYEENSKIVQRKLKKIFETSQRKKSVAKSNGSLGGRPKSNAKLLKLQELSKPNGYSSESKIEPGAKQEDKLTEPIEKLSLLLTPYSLSKTNEERIAETHEASQKPWHDRTADLIEMLIQAANGNVVHGSEGVENVRPILDLLAMDCDLESDILPAVAEHIPKLPDPLRTWAARFLRDAILGRKAKRLNGRGAPSERPKPTPETQELMAKQYAANRCEVWRSESPRPGYPGCVIAPEILRKHGIDPETGKRANP